MAQECRVKRAEKDEELTDEAVEPRQSNRRERYDHEECREQWHDLREPAKLRNEAGMSTVVDHPDDEEERAC